MPVIQRQSTDPAKSITSTDVTGNQGASNGHIL